MEIPFFVKNNLGFVRNKEKVMMQLGDVSEFAISLHWHCIELK